MNTNTEINSEHLFIDTNYSYQRQQSVLQEKGLKISHSLLQMQFCPHAFSFGEHAFGFYFWVNSTKDNQIV